MWGNHWLQNHPRNLSQNSSKCVNHPVRIGRGAAWSPWAGNVTNHIPHCNCAIFSAPGPPPTSSSSANQYICNLNSKVHLSSCSPSGPMAPHGKCGRNPEKATFRITGGEVLQGATPCLKNYAKSTIVLLIQYLYDDHGTISPMDIEKSENKMEQEWSLLDPMVDLFEKLKKKLSLQKPLTPQSQEGKWSLSLTCWSSGQEGCKKPVNSGKTFRLGWKPGRLSKTISHKPTGATISARNQQ